MQKKFITTFDELIYRVTNVLGEGIENLYARLFVGQPQCGRTIDVAQRQPTVYLLKIVTKKHIRMQIHRVAITQPETISHGSGHMEPQGWIGLEYKIFS